MAGVNEKTPDTNCAGVFLEGWLFGKLSPARGPDLQRCHFSAATSLSSVESQQLVPEQQDASSIRFPPGPPGPPPGHNVVIVASGSRGGSVGAAHPAGAGFGLTISQELPFQDQVH